MYKLTDTFVLILLIFAVFYHRIKINRRPDVLPLKPLGGNFPSYRLVDTKARSMHAVARQPVNQGIYPGTNAPMRHWHFWGGGID